MVTRRRHIQMSGQLNHYQRGFSLACSSKLCSALFIRTGCALHLLRASDLAQANRCTLRSAGASFTHVSIMIVERGTWSRREGDQGKRFENDHSFGMASTIKCTAQPVEKGRVKPLYSEVLLNILINRYAENSTYIMIKKPV